MKSKRFMFEKPKVGVSELFLKLVFYCIYEYETIYLPYLKEQNEKGSKEKKLSFAEFTVENIMGIQEAMSPMLFSLLFGMYHTDGEEKPIDKLMMAKYISNAMDMIKEEEKKQHEEV